MAIRFVENFEWAASDTMTQKYSRSNTNCEISPAHPAMSGRFLLIWNSPTEFQTATTLPLPGSYTAGVLSFAHYTTASRFSTAASRFVSLRSGNAHQICLRRDEIGRLVVLRDTFVLGTTDSVINLQNTRYRIELGFQIHGSSGTIRLDVDGVTRLVLTGQNTRNGFDTVDNILLGLGANESLSTTTEAGYQPGDGYDDILFDDDHLAFRGDWFGKSLYTNSDIVGYSTPSAGTRFANLANSPASAIGYNTFPSLGVDRYGLSDLTVDSTSTIHAVSLLYRGYKTDVGPAKLRPTLWSGPNSVVCPTTSINSAPLLYDTVIQLDPQGNQPWTVDRVNALEMAVERTV